LTQTLHELKYLAYISKQQSASNTMAHHHDDTTLVELNIFHVKPKYIFHFLSHVQQIKKLLEKHGVKVCATWTAEAGASGQVYLLTKHASYAARAKFHDEHLTDHEWLTMHKHTAKFVYYNENFLCKPNHHVVHKEFSPAKKYLLQFLHVKDFPVFAHTKIWEASAAAEKAIGAHAAHAVAMLHPMLNSHNCTIMIRELPDNNIDESLNAHIDAILDPHHWAHMYDTFRHVTREKNILVHTPPFEKLPKPEEH
jgi:hypothetical protein